MLKTSIESNQQSISSLLFFFIRSCMDKQARILIVDDDVLMRDTMRRVLQSAGYQTLLAETGQEALGLLHASPLDLALVDVNMPDMNGFEVCQRIKSDPELNGVSVIILSGALIGSDNKVIGLDLGADDYIARPVPNPELLARIRAVLRVKVAEDALRSRENQLQVLISANIDGMLVVDQQGSVRLANTAACQLLERPLAQLVGSPIELPSGVEGGAELEIGLPEGGVRTLELRSTTIQWQEIPASLVSLRDISRRKHAENQLRESKEKYRLLTENIKDVVWTLDAESERFLYVSPSIQKLRGYTPEEVVLAPLDAALLPQAAAPFRNLLIQFLGEFRSGKFGPDRFFILELEQPCKDGSNVWTEVIVSFYTNEKSGRIEVLGVSRDITERRQTEEALRVSEKRFAITLDAVNDGIWDWQIESGEKFFSKNYYAILGYENSEFPANYAGWRSKIHPNDIAQAEKILQRSIENGEAFSIDLRMQLKNAGWRWFCMRGRAVERQADGRVVRMLGTLSDISVRKQAEAELREAQVKLEQRVNERTRELKIANTALEKASRMKDEFLANMSHELRTPLTGILGLAQVLQMQTYGELSEKQLQALHNIEASGRHLLELINDILDYSRIEAGKLNLRISPCSLAEVCQASLHAINSQVQKKQQKISLSVDPASIIVPGDVRRLKQILVNLLSNAVKFTSSGGSLGIEVVGRQNGDPVRITVWDTGIGISASDIPRLFQPFSQLDGRLERQYSGTGLGLSLVKRLVELHGGGVSVESAPGAGSRFTFTLPTHNEKQI
jgi:PAS domain S-box-containing protein